MEDLLSIPDAFSRTVNSSTQFKNISTAFIIAFKKAMAK